MPTANIYLTPNNGWTLVATAPKFVRVSGFPHTHPYYLAAAASTPLSDPSQGSGTVTFSTGVPTANQTVTVGGETYTFKASRVNPFEVAIGGTNLITATNFTNAVNTDSTLVHAVDVAGVVTLTSYVAGTVGNYALATTGSNTAVSGAAFTGGADPVIGQLVCHKPWWNNVTMTENLYARQVSPVPNSSRADGKLRIDVITV